MCGLKELNIEFRTKSSKLILIIADPKGKLLRSIETLLKSKTSIFIALIQILFLLTPIKLM